MIQAIEIQNWKAFETTKVALRPGLNLLIGRNAAGKTTLLDAISLALTGEALQASEIKHLIRDKRRSSTITIRLDAQGRQLELRRTFSVDRLGGAWLREDGQERALTWEQATSRVEEVAGAHREFFQRITYMSEGATVEYLRDPPRRALTSQIERLFGIDVLQQVVRDLKEFRRHLKQEESDLEVVLSEVEVPADLDVRVSTVTDQFQVANTELIEYRKNIQSVLANVSELQNRKNILSRADGIVHRLFHALETEGHKLADSENPAEQLLIIRRDALSRARDDLDAAKSQANFIQTRMAYYDDLEKIALESEKALLTNPTGQKCPVCKRPLEKSHVAAILADIRSERPKLNALLAAANDRIIEAQRRIERLEAARNEAEHLATELKTYLQQVTLSRPAELKDALESIDKALVESRTRLSELEQTAAALQQQVQMLGAEKARLEAAKATADRLVSARSRQVHLSASDLLAEVVVNAVSEGVDTERRTNVAAIQSGLSTLWGRFRGAHESIEFLPDGQMFLLRNGDRLSFDQLSGGEKTVLLVLSHTIASRALSNLDFLLIDEPLEHLDIDNRRSLLNFLVQAVKREFIPQIIVSTFEESLTRKYLEESKVNAIYL